MVEFALVLPLFLLLVLGIIDFGWLFYNYIAVENSARNAARIACVEYMNCNVKEQNNVKYPYYYLDDNHKDKNYDFGVMKNHINSEDDYYTDEEINIYKAASASLPNSITSPEMTIKYSYDEQMFTDTYHYIINDRSTGTVTVTVKGKLHVLTPVLSAFSENGEKTLTSKATYKVEVRPNDTEVD